MINAGLGTLQMNSISVSPFTPENEALTGTQDNGTLAFSGKPTWILPLTGDGGDTGFDAVDPNLRFHTYTGGQMDVNYNGDDPTSWLWIGDRFIVNFPESQRFYAPAISDPNVTEDDLRRGAARVADAELPAVTAPSSRRTATPPSASSRATCSTRGPAARRPTGRRSALRR